MNWYKTSQVAVINDTIIVPPDINDQDDDNNDCWRKNYKEVQEWVKKNIKQEPIISIQNQLVENIAITKMQYGISPDVMLWHEDLDFFRGNQYRAATISLTFSAFNGEAVEGSGEFDVSGSFDMSKMQEQWISVLRQSTLKDYLAGIGCKTFIDNDLYEFVLGEICNNMCYNNLEVAQTFQMYLEKNIKRMEKDIVQRVAMGELGRYRNYRYLIEELKLGNEIDMNKSLQCYPSDYRFDTIGIIFNAKFTCYLTIPDESAEQVIMEFDNELV